MKNALITAVVGLLFMSAGFAVGFHLMPKPKPVPAPVAAAPTMVTPPGAAVPVPVADAITLDTLKKTSESMMSLNVALAEREKRVAEREAKRQAARGRIRRRSTFGAGCVARKIQGALQRFPKPPATG